jgi:hypothetical protein
VISPDRSDSGLEIPEPNPTPITPVALAPSRSHRNQYSSGEWGESKYAGHTEDFHNVSSTHPEYTATPLNIPVPSPAVESPEADAQVPLFIPPTKSRRRRGKTDRSSNTKAGTPAAVPLSPAFAVVSVAEPTHQTGSPMLLPNLSWSDIVSGKAGSPTQGQCILDLIELGEPCHASALLIDQRSPCHPWVLGDRHVHLNHRTTWVWSPPPPMWPQRVYIIIWTLNPLRWVTFILPAPTGRVNRAFVHMWTAPSLQEKL